MVEQVYLSLDPALSAEFPGLAAEVIVIKGVEVRKESTDLENFRAKVVERAKGRWTLEQLREHPIFRAYRDFFWRIGVDPTKNRPASEALIRRVLHGNPLPKINTLVDLYNLASIETAIPLAAFDEGGLVGDLLMREARKGELFRGIGMDDYAEMKGGEVVIADGEKLVAVYPYRDAEASKVTEKTRNVLMLVCGVPNIDKDALKRAGDIAVEYVTRFCDGKEWQGRE